ncbi:MAG: hypothetical protein EXR53_06365 [Dehalococcoidia bacterium]|nr:hypothetical protein [Dehalococcoidia bacterium]
MDFEMTPAAEEKEMDLFRQEVRSWLTENIAEEMKESRDPDDWSVEKYQYWRGKHKELAQKGWLNPTYPKEYGGGGLTGAHAAVIVQEMRTARAVGDLSNRRPPEAMMVWGSEEQKQKFVAPLLRGEITCWQKLTEPHSGSDLASYKSTAVRDGDEWVLNGSNVFISGRGPSPNEGPDYLFGPMMTDKNAPRHRNLGYFAIPVHVPGVEIRAMDLLMGRDSHFVFLNDVRVPGDHLIGGDHQGWQVLSTQLEQEHGGDGGGNAALAPDQSLENLLSYVRTSRVNGNSLGKDPLVAQSAAATYIDSHIDKLFSLRAYWIHEIGAELRHEGGLSHLYNKEFGIRNANRVRDDMGAYCLLGIHEPLAPHEGHQEMRLRSSIALSHLAGSLNIGKVVLARRMGISRTQERAAPMRTTGAKAAH